MNSNVMGLNGNFKRSIITDDVTLGFHKKQYAVVNLITKQVGILLKQHTP